MAQESYWFKHDFNSRSDPKLVKLTIKHGMAGVGVYWCLIELMYEQGGYLSVSELDVYAHSFRVSLEMIEDIVRNFKLFTVDEEKFWSSRVIIGREEIDNRVAGAKKAIKARWDKAKGINGDTKSETTVVKIGKSVYD